MKGVPFPRPRGVADAIALLAASAGLTGRFPFAPGTVGSAVACLLWLLAGSPGAAGLAIALAAGIPLAVWSSDRAAALAGGKDPSWVVADEVVGQWIAILAAPPRTVAALAVPFLLFRVFDVWKPFPARSLERLPGGYGIVADDLMAGIYAGIASFVVARSGILPW